METSPLYAKFQEGNPVFKDRFFDTIIDTIVAYEAKYYVTCTDLNSNLCRGCSRLNSNYIHHVISHRKEEGLQHTTFHRWDYDFSKHPTDTHSNSG